MADVNLYDVKKLSKGTEIAGFVLDKKIGSGGMGEVWLAHQSAMAREVAIKILYPHLMDDPTFLERFLKEVRISAKLDHPNIITAHDAGEFEGIYYLALSYVDGVELQDKLDDIKIFEEDEALKITRSIADALKYAWEDFNILHRDIKPSNIMIDSKNRAKLMDMGISKSTAEDHSLTMTGAMVGTPYFMSPEQALGDKNIDFRADVYSLGATLYNLVAGSPPYEASTAMAIINKHMNADFPPIKEKNKKISLECENLLRIMLAKRKENRQSSWDDVIQDIDLVLNKKAPKTSLPNESKDAEKSIAETSVKSQSDKKGKQLLIGGVIIFFILVAIAVKIIFSANSAQKSNLKQENMSSNSNKTETSKITKNKNQNNKNITDNSVNITKPVSNEITPVQSISKIKPVSVKVNNEINKTICDDDINSYWEEDNNQHQEIIIDLGQTKSLAELQIIWTSNNSMPNVYEVQLIDASANTTKLFSTEKALEKNKILSLETPFQCQYIKIKLSKWKMLGYSLSEVNIKGF